MFNIVRKDTGTSVGYRKTYKDAIRLATVTRDYFGLSFNSVFIARLGTPRRINKTFYYKTRVKGHWKAWDE